MAMVASFVTVGGQLLMPGVAALCRNWPGRDDWQVLQIVIISPFVLMLPYVWWVPPSEEFHSAGRGGLILEVLSQAMACTAHSAIHRTAHPNKQCSLSPVICLPSPSVLFVSIFICSVCILPVPLWRLFPESLRWLLATQHYRRSKAMMLRIAKKNQIDMTTEPSGVLTGEDIFKKGANQCKSPCYKCILSFALYISICLSFEVNICVVLLLLLSMWWNEHAMNTEALPHIKPFHVTTVLTSSLTW